MNYVPVMWPGDTVTLTIKTTITEDGSVPILGEEWDPDSLDSPGVRVDELEFAAGMYPVQLHHEGGAFSRTVLHHKHGQWHYADDESGTIGDPIPDTTVVNRIGPRIGPRHDLYARP